VVSIYTCPQNFWGFPQNLGRKKFEKYLLLGRGPQDIFCWGAARPLSTALHVAIAFRVHLGIMLPNFVAIARTILRRYGEFNNFSITAVRYLGF